MGPLGEASEVGELCCMCLPLTLNQLALNDYSLKYSFEAAARIGTIPDRLYDEGYTMVSFDVKILFTSAPSETIDEILDGVYDQH